MAKSTRWTNQAVTQLVSAVISTHLTLGTPSSGNERYYKLPPLPNDIIDLPTLEAIGKTAAASRARLRLFRLVSYFIDSNNRIWKQEYGPHLSTDCEVPTPVVNQTILEGTEHLMECNLVMSLEDCSTVTHAKIWVFVNTLGLLGLRDKDTIMRMLQFWRRDGGTFRHAKTAASLIESFGTIFGGSSSDLLFMLKLIAVSAWHAFHNARGHINLDDIDAEALAQVVVAESTDKDQYAGVPAEASQAYKDSGNVNMTLSMQHVLPSTPPSSTLPGESSDAVDPSPASTATPQPSIPSTSTQNQATIEMIERVRSKRRQQSLDNAQRVKEWKQAKAAKTSAEVDQLASEVPTVQYAKDKGTFKMMHRDEVWRIYRAGLGKGRHEGRLLGMKENMDAELEPLKRELVNRITVAEHLVEMQGKRDRAWWEKTAYADGKERGYSEGWKEGVEAGEKKGKRACFEQYERDIAALRFEKNNLQVRLDTRGDTQPGPSKPTAIACPVAHVYNAVGGTPTRPVQGKVVRSVVDLELMATADSGVVRKRR